MFVWGLEVAFKFAPAISALPPIAYVSPSRSKRRFGKVERKWTCCDALYGFGVARPGPVARLTFTALPGSCSGGVIIAKFSGHVVVFRSSPTVLADSPTSGSTSTRILFGKPPRASRSPGSAFCLVSHWIPPSFFVGRGIVQYFLRSWGPPDVVSPRDQLTLTKSFSQSR